MLRILRRLRILIDNCIHIYGLNEEEILTVKNSLTFSNPAYETTQKYSRYAYTNVPPYLTFYREFSDHISVPLGYSLSNLFCSDLSGMTQDNRVLSQVPAPKFVLDLRDSQKQAAEMFFEKNSSNSLNGCIQLPTGKGKSILGLYIASRLNTKTLIVVHKDDLVKGWKDDIHLAFGGKTTPGLIKAKSRTVGSYFTIATVQTLNKLSPDELSKLYSTFGFIIQDEMHHCPASSFAVVNNFKSRYRLGLTATPERTDGLAILMNLYFGNFCYVYSDVPRYEEDEKDILPVKVIVKNTNAYFNPLCEAHRRGDKTFYKVSDLFCPEDKVLSGSQRRLSEIPYELRPKVSFHVIDDFVVRAIKEQVCDDIIAEYDKGHSCIVFFTKKEHCRLYYEYLSQSVSPDHLGIYYGDNKDNEAVLEKAKKIRKFITLTTYAKATEGTNVRQWEVEFLVSSLNNGKNTEQAVGRIRRTQESNKLSTAILYDYRSPKVYSVSSHGKTRDMRYRKLKFSFESTQDKRLFSRGFR